MDYKKMKNIVDGIVKNEFRHIQETLEKEFTDTNLDYRQNRSATEGIYKALEKDTTEDQQRLIGDLEDSISSEWIELCRFYFREGLRAGLENLKFLNEIYNIGYIIYLEERRVHMAKIQIKYENEIEKIKILEVLSKGIKINKISKPSKTGRYYRVYVDIE